MKSKLYWKLRRFFFEKVMGSRTLHHFVGNRGVQSCLEKNIKASRFLMGIGWGTHIETSGEKEILRRFERAGRLRSVFDVGANRGQFVSHLLDVADGRRPEIHCFEPTTSAYDELTSSYPDSEYVNITKNNVALGEEPGSATIFYDQPGSGSASLHKETAKESEQVDVITMDRYCEEAGIGHVDLMKIDVEGHELSVLLGAQRIFEAGKVDAVMFEFGPHHIPTGTMLYDFYSFFSDHGMRLFRITPSGYLHPLDEYKEVHEQFGVTNYLAVDDIPAE